MSELISVVIPTFNRAGFIERAVQSVLQQSWGHREVIVIDDGSTDHTEELLLRFQSTPGFRYIYQPRAGRSAARNHGTSAANGNWIMFLDSDDYLMPHALETLYRLANSSDSEVAYANFHFVDGNNKTKNSKWNFSATELNRRLLLELVNGRYWLAKTGSYILKKYIAVETGGFATGFEPSEDLDFSIKVLLRAKASYTNDIILYVERHQGNTPEPDMLDASVRVCKNYITPAINWPPDVDAGEIRKIRFALRYKAANALYELNRHGEALGSYIKLIGNRPFIIFDKFIFKQFFASMIPPAVKKKLRRINKSPL